MLLFEWTLGLLLVAVALAALSRRIGAPYPSLLALAGAALAFLPIGRVPAIDPELALALFVAPVLLDAAFDTSPRDLKTNLRPLLSLAFVAVLLTTAAVAWVGWRFAGLPLAAAVALGAIVAPPDAAAASTVLAQLRPPERVLNILKGESLLNDATALLVYRVAVIAAGASLSLQAAAPMLVLGAVGGPIVGYVAARLYMWATMRLTDAPSAVVTQFVGAFGIWLLADRLQLSAVLTTVVFAMTIARRAPRRTDPRVRVSSYSVWETAVFVLNVLAFTLMGLQARAIFERLRGPEQWHALALAGLVLVTVVGVRVAYVLAWNVGLTVKNRTLGVDLPEGVRPPNLRSGALVAWCGMRGLITLATAIALPREFPGRDLIVLCAFTVVLGTLVAQGFTLPLLLRWLKLEPDNLVERDVSKARTAALKSALHAIHGEESEAALAVRAELKAQWRVAKDEAEPQAATEHDELRLKALSAIRETLHDLRSKGEIADEAYFRLIEEADWNELAAAPAGRYASLTT